MKFPYSEELALPCTFERVVQGQLHRDGRRYLPLLVFRLAPPTDDADAQHVTPPAMLIGVVDRHHAVDLAMVGQEGRVQLVFLLGQVQLQDGVPRQGFQPEDADPNRASTRPSTWGRIVRVATWEAEHEHLPYETLYTELIIDIGGATIGVRTSATADNLAMVIGKSALEADDWITVGPSRIDILGFAAN